MIAVPIVEHDKKSCFHNYQLETRSCCKLNRTTANNLVGPPPTSRRNVREIDDESDDTDESDQVDDLIQ